MTRKRRMGGEPEYSVLVPVHNEEAILEAAVHHLLARLPRLGRSFEIVLAENGSTDRTARVAADLAREHPEVKCFSGPAPDYGLALRRAISLARGRYVLCDEIDICDVEFHGRALGLLDNGAADLVVGSKAMRGAEDLRPLGRRVATRVVNGLLRVLLGFSGTDTHGLKAFRREVLAPVAESCIVGRDLFASEFVIRAERAGLKVVEIPVTIQEKRPPSIDLARRVPAVIGGLARLFVAIRLGRRL